MRATGLCTKSRLCTVAAVGEAQVRQHAASSYDRRQCRSEFFIFNIVGGHRPPLQFGSTIRYDFLCKASPVGGTIRFGGFILIFVVSQWRALFVGSRWLRVCRLFSGAKKPVIDE